VSILPGLEAFLRRGESLDDVMDMISDLIEQANANHLAQLAASARDDHHMTWARYNEGFRLERDIDTLSKLYTMTTRSTGFRLPPL
jgi:hypothetical protein